MSRVARITIRSLATAVPKLALARVPVHTPDILCIAKGLTSGYMPLGVTVLSDEVHDVIRESQEDGALALGYTYTAHATSCAAALKNIEILERENICGHVSDVGPYLQEKAKELHDLSIVGDVRGSHFMLGVELVCDKHTKQSFEPSVDITNRVFKLCLERGVMVRPVGNTIVLSPPLILTKDECDTIVDVLHKSIEEVISELQGEGVITA